MDKPLKPILVFDSGVGGLTVLREARVLIPERNFLYVADDAAFPYGGWPESDLKAHLLNLFDDLLNKYEPELCVIACNTAFTLAGADLRRAFPNTVFVGTVPAIKPAAEKTHTGLVSVLATPGTVQREYTYELIRSYANNCEINLVGAPKLALLAEQYIRGKKIDYSKINHEIKACFIKKSECKRTDIVVLACTHYPFIVNILRYLAPWPVDWLDPAHAIAKRVRELIKSDHDVLHLVNNDRVVFTSNSPDFVTLRLMSSFGLKVLDAT